MKLDLDPFKRLIRSRCGLVFEGVSERRLAAVVSERMGSSDEARYLVLLEASADEFRELVNRLTINETYFFREVEQIRLLTDALVPRLMSRRAAGTPIRILSAGCSSGEEPYSLAMALFDRFGEATPRIFSIVAGDIDTTVIARAREARYTEFSFRGVSQELRDRYFSVEHNSYRLRESVRNAVEFCELNLLNPCFDRQVQKFDVVFMRNVSIYFDVPTRREILSNLAALMSTDGFLVTGITETLANDLGVFVLVEDDGLYYFCKRESWAAPAQKAAARAVTPARRAPQTGDRSRISPHAPRAAPKAMTPSPLAESAPPVRTRAGSPSAAVPATPRTLEVVRALVHDERYDDAAPLLSKLLEAHPGNNDARLLQAYIHLNRRHFDLVMNACNAVLENDAWSVDARFVMGLAEKWRDQRDSAIAWFKKTAYLHPQCWPAHFYLAGLYAHQGDHASARRAHRVVMQLLAGEPDPGIRVVPVGLRPADVRFLCERRLNDPQRPLPAGGR